VTQSTGIGLAGLANLPHELALLVANWIKLALLANGRRPHYLRLETLGRRRPGGVCNRAPTLLSDQDSHFFQFSSSFSRARSQSTISPSSLFSSHQVTFFLGTPVICKQSWFSFGASRPTGYRAAMAGCANSGRSTTAWPTGQIDQSGPFADRVGPAVPALSLVSVNGVNSDSLPLC
jgi:hypothetical protein